MGSCISYVQYSIKLLNKTTDLVLGHKEKKPKFSRVFLTRLAQDHQPPQAKNGRFFAVTRELKQHRYGEIQRSE